MRADVQFTRPPSVRLQLLDDYPDQAHVVFQQEGLRVTFSTSTDEGRVELARLFEQAARDLRNHDRAAVS